MSIARTDALPDESEGVSPSRETGRGIATVAALVLAPVLGPIGLAGAWFVLAKGRWWSTRLKVAAGLVVPAALPTVVAAALTRNRDRRCVSYGGPFRCVTEPHHLNMGFLVAAFFVVVAAFFVTRLLSALPRGTKGSRLIS
jgi:formate hydrogenlyase subunit 3/multisubunit Na+/H+ antiporter MnhD subunit